MQQERIAPDPSGPGTAVTAPVLEVFASIQGEGLYVGQAQSFVRLRGCPLRCRWCDTPSSWSVDEAATARIAAPDGPRREDAVATPFRVACWIAEVETGTPRPVSLTGGEPLLWPDFVFALKGMIGERRLHLETGGGHPETLARVLPRCDHVSLDLKLPADLDPPVELVGEGTEANAAVRADGRSAGRVTGERAPRDEAEWTLARRRSLQLVQEHDACAKIVLVGGRSARDYDPLLEDVARIAPELPLFVQPATPMRAERAPSASELLELLEAARDLELDVRVMPQMHRALNLP